MKPGDKATVQAGSLKGKSCELVSPCEEPANRHKGGATQAAWVVKVDGHDLPGLVFEKDLQAESP